MFPGLDAIVYCQTRSSSYQEDTITFLVLFRRLVNYRAMLQTSQIKHSNATVGTTAHENIDTICAESDIEDFFIVSY